MFTISMRSAFVTPLVISLNILVLSWYVCSLFVEVDVVDGDSIGSSGCGIVHIGSMNWE